MPRPLVHAALAFAAGCAAGGELPTSAAWVLLALSGLLLATALLRPAAHLAGVALLAAGVALGAGGAAAAGLAYRSADLLRFAAGDGERGAPLRVEGRAVVDGASSGDRLRLVIDVEHVTRAGERQVTRGRARIDVLGQGPFPEVLAGDRVALWATLRPPSRFGNPGAFDAPAHARRDGVHLHGTCKSARLVETAPPAQRGLRRLAAEARAWARRRLEVHVPPGSELALVRAMLLGDRSTLDDETDERFRAAGTYHVLALSGAQVALLAFLVSAAARRAGLGPAASALLLIAGVSFYAAFVGGDVPVVRAAVMAAVLAGGRALDLDGDLVNLLGLAALALLAARPAAVGDVGFQLSFVATWAVVALTPRLAAGWPRLPLRAELALASSLAAQAGLLPLLAVHFQRLAPAALLLNLAAVPLSAAVLLGGLLVLAASVVGGAPADLAGDLAWIAAHALRHSADLMELLPWLDVRVPTPPAWALPVYAAGLLGWLHGARRAAPAALLATGLFGILAGPGPRPADGRLHLTMLDVGQGDALVLRSPRGRALLVDAGGGWSTRFDVGEAVVAPYLWSQGITRLDAVALTHAHPDHVGGVPFLLRALRVSGIWEGPAPRQDAAYAALDPVLRRAGATRRALVAGMRFEWEGAELRVLGPAAPARPPWRVRNDDSLVLGVRFGEVTLLLTGDAEAAGERAAAVPAAVLKVPHHGSRTSSARAFVAAVAPTLALVSAGRGNHFGHPHAEVLARYERAGVHLRRTDRDGAVTVSTDGRRLWVTTFAEGRERRLR